MCVYYDHSLLYFISVEKLYSFICECQTLYPDPELSDDSQDEGEELNEGEEEEVESEGGVFYTSAEEGLPNLSAQGRVRNG